ncbi:hypothetical protein ACFC1T_09705 [Kitasatospora sp. NPDC056076]|uniref:hypothetical protein n=1 Tax=Kitasatospora sp. NPDC056076 TaxID=3345703 RepID=UPI0035DD45C4
MFGRPVDGSGLCFTVDDVLLCLEPFTGWQAVGWASSGAWAEIIPKALDPDSLDAVSQWLSDPDDPFNLAQCHRIAVGLAEEIYGVPWWAAVRLCSTAVSHWRAYAPWCTAKAFGPENSSATMICASVLAWLADTCEQKEDWSRMEAKIFTPPASARGTQAAPMMSVDDFAAQMARMQAAGEEEDDD